METLSCHIPRLFDKEYVSDSPSSFSPHIHSPVTGVRWIGGVPFEVVVLKTKRFVVPYHCYSCSRIRETLLGVADDDTEDLSDEPGGGRRGADGSDDGGIGEWTVHNENLERYWIGSSRKGLAEDKSKEDTKGGVKFSQGYFKGPKSMKYSTKSGATSSLSDKQKYTLKYTHRDEADSQESQTKAKKADLDVGGSRDEADSQESQTTKEKKVDADVNDSVSYGSTGKEEASISSFNVTGREDASMSSYSVTEDLKPWPSFAYVDTRLEYYSPRNSNIQIQNHDDLKQFCQESISYTDGNRKDREKFSDVFSSDVVIQSMKVDLDADDFIHYVDHKFHLEHYKLHKHMSREKEARAVSAKQKESEQHLSLPRILRELPEALRADLEFWSTYDTARKKQTGKASEDSKPFLPHIDVTKESLINLALLDQQKKDIFKQRGDKESGLMGFEKKGSNKNKRKSKASTTRKFQHKHQSGGLLSHTALKGGTAPKHFVDTFNALRVKSSGHAIEIDKELQQELQLFCEVDSNIILKSKQKI